MVKSCNYYQCPKNLTVKTALRNLFMKGHLGDFLSSWKPGLRNVLSLPKKYNNIQARLKFGYKAFFHFDKTGPYLFLQPS